MGRAGARPWQCNEPGRWMWSQASWCPQAGEDSDKPTGVTTERGSMSEGAVADERCEGREGLPTKCPLTLRSEV